MSEQQLQTSYGTMLDGADARQREREKKQKRLEYDQKLQALADMAIKYENVDEGMYTLLESFLDVALEMQTMMDALTAINTGMETITDAISFIDEALNFDNVMMDMSNVNNYGFFARLKQKNKIKKTIRNNRGRVMAIAQTLQMKYQMAADMRNALMSVTKNLKTIITPVKRGKKNVPAAPVDGPAKRMLAQRKAAMNGEDTAPTPPPSSPSSSGSSSDFDISGII